MDNWAIQQAGFYLPRHGVLVLWPLPELAHRLTGAGPARVRSARQQLRHLASAHW